MVSSALVVPLPLLQWLRLVLVTSAQSVNTALDKLLVPRIVISVLTNQTLVNHLVSTAQLATFVMLKLWKIQTLAQWVTTALLRPQAS